MKTLRKAWLAIPLVLASLTLSPLARADNTAEARRLFDAGARAYKVGQFRAAIQAFEQAYRVEARPNILFSIAQAHRRQYVLDKRPGHVAVAIKLYREFLSQVPQGGRRADAVAALGEMEPVAAQLERDGQLQPIGVGESATRVVISSASDGATIELDGSTKARPLPLIAEVKPGKHTIRLRAPGYADEQREIEVAPGGVTALDIPLRELPARVAIGGYRGAEVRVDDRSVGTLPFTGPLDVAPGRHVLRIAKGGHEDHVQSVDLPRAGALTIEARQPRTLQRKISYGLLGGGVVSGATGLVLGFLSLSQQGVASGIKSEIDAGKVVCREVACPKFDDYNAAVGARDRLRIASGVMVGVGVGAAATGMLMFLFDEPKARGTVPGSDEGPRAPRPVEKAFDVGAMVAPGLYGVSITGGF